MHGCVVLASSAPSLPCKRAGRRASSGISFSNAVQQAQLSYPKSAQLCRLLEAFEGFGCRSSPQPQTLLDQQYLEDVDCLILRRRVKCSAVHPCLHSIPWISQHDLAKIRSSPLLARLALHLTRNLYLTHRRRQTAANHTLLSIPGTWDVGDGKRQIKRAPRMKVLSKSPSHAIVSDLPTASGRPSTAARPYRPCECLTWEVLRESR